MISKLFGPEVAVFEGRHLCSVLSPWPSYTDSVTGEGGQGLEELLVGWMRPRVVDRITALALWEAQGRSRAPTTGREGGRWGGRC